MLECGGLYKIIGDCCELPTTECEKRNAKSERETLKAGNAGGVI
ncbi:MAG: hypothetical protein OCU24_06095 [Candidatus Methanospirare jalkutatii]|nr:hypothetical protein [Candidatus Methanospirare jalkutatii]